MRGAILTSENKHDYSLDLKVDPKSLVSIRIAWNHYFSRWRLLKRIILTQCLDYVSAFGFEFLAHLHTYYVTILLLLYIQRLFLEIKVIISSVMFLRIVR